MINRRIVHITGSVMFWAWAEVFCSLAPRESFAAEKIRIFYSAITGEQSAFYIIKESGMFQKYGLDPEIIYLDSGTIAVQAMLSGEIQLGLLGSTAAISSSLRGSDIKIIAGMINNLTYVLMSDPKINRPDQLKGSKIAIARFGSLSDFGVRLALKRLNVPLSDVTLLQLGGGQTARLAALKSGVVQAAIFAPPITRVAREQGFYSMLDMIKEKFEYAGSAIAASGAFLREKPDVAARFMRAYVAGIHYAKTHREESMRITARYMKSHQLGGNLQHLHSGRRAAQTLSNSGRNSACARSDCRRRFKGQHRKAGTIRRHSVAIGVRPQRLHRRPL